MSQFGKRLVRSARQARAIAREDVEPPRTYIIDEESEAFKQLKDAHESGKRVSTKGMTSEEFKRIILGKEKD